MSLVLHIFFKEFRLLRVYLAGWLGLAILQVVSWPGSGIRRIGADIPEYQMILVVVTSVSQFFLLAAIVARLVQSDSLVSSTAFWLSRPVTGRQLLAGKLFFLLTSLVLPSLLIEMLILTGNGVIARDVLRSIPLIVFQQLCVVAVLMMLSVLTRDLARMVLLGIGSMVTLTWISQMLPHVFGSGGGAGISLPATLKTSQWIVAGLCTLAVAALVVGRQYLRRRTRVSMILGCLGISLCCLSLEFWTWDFLRAAFRPDRQVIDSAQVAVRVEERSLQFRRNEYRQRVLQGEISLTNVPSNLVVVPIRIVSHVTQSSREKTFTHTDQNPHVGERNPIFGDLSRRKFDEGMAERLLRALGGGHILNRDLPNDPPYLPSFLQITDEIYERYRSSRMEFSAQVDFLVQRDGIATLQPRVGSRYDRGSDHAEIFEVAVNKDICTIKLKERGPHLALDHPKSRLYVLRNPIKREALLGDEQYSYYDLSVSAFHPFVPMLLKFNEGAIEFRLPSGDGPSDPNWFHDAELVRIETSNLGRFSKSVRLEDLVMDQIPVL